MLALSLALASTACTLSVASPTEEPNIATMIAGTMSAIQTQNPSTPEPTLGFPTVSATEAPTATGFPTLLAPSAVPSLPVVQPTAILPNATRINFQAGATTAVLTAPIAAGATANYVLRAGQGQPMIVQVTSPNDDVTLSIKTQGGTSMLNATSGHTNWQGSLPQSEDYYLSLHGGGADENFTLNIVIPSRIKFLPGAVSAKLTGKTVGGYNTSYVAFASKGQKMTVDLSDLSNTAAITIWGWNDGQLYVNANMGATPHFAFTLPATQDYVIQVVPQGGLVVSYTITVQIQ
jgi:hypothetical protein